MIIDLTRQFTNEEWAEREKYFSLYFAMLEDDRLHAETWDRKNTPHDDQIPDETWCKPDFDWEEEYDKLWEKYWDAIKYDKRAIAADEFYDYYVKVFDAYQAEARERERGVYQIRKYQMRDCYEWLSRRGNVDILLNPFDNNCHVRCKEYDYTCWTMHEQPAEFFLASSKFVKARDEWGWTQINLEELQAYKQAKAPQVSAEQRQKLRNQIMEFVVRNSTGAWFYYARNHTTPVSWVFEKKSDAMMVKLRW